MHGHASQVRTNALAFARVHVALGAVLLEHFLACRQLSLLLYFMQQFGDHLFAVRVGQAALSLEHLLRTSPNCHVGMDGERLPLIQREINKLERAGIDSVEQRASGCWSAQEHANRSQSSGRAQHPQTLDEFLTESWRLTFRERP